MYINEPGIYINEPGIFNRATLHAQKFAGPSSHLMAAGTLTGGKVVNGANDDLGKIEEIMLDVPTGHIAYAVMSSGGFLGMGERLFAIPWQALQLDTDKKCFVLDIDKKRLENAPGFDKDYCPPIANTAWAINVHAYYGRRPYWE